MMLWSVKMIFFQGQIIQSEKKKNNKKELLFFFITHGLDDEKDV